MPNGVGGYVSREGLGNGTSREQLWRLKTAGTADVGGVSVWPISTSRSLTSFLLVHTRLPSHPVTHYCRRLKMNFSKRIKKNNEKNCPKCDYKAKQTSGQLWLQSLHKVLRQPLYYPINQTCYLSLPTLMLELGSGCSVQRLNGSEEKTSTHSTGIPQLKRRLSQGNLLVHRHPSLPSTRIPFASRLGWYRMLKCGKADKEKRPTAKQNKNNNGKGMLKKRNPFLLLASLGSQEHGRSSGESLKNEMMSFFKMEVLLDNLVFLKIRNL